jgi:hypothetical protein
MNTIFLLVARNSKLGFKNLQTKAAVKMNVEGLETLVFTHVHFTINIDLVDDSFAKEKS